MYIYIIDDKHVVIILLQNCYSSKYLVTYPLYTHCVSPTALWSTMLLLARTKGVRRMETATRLIATLSKYLIIRHCDEILIPLTLIKFIS